MKRIVQKWPENDVARPIVLSAQPGGIYFARRLLTVCPLQVARQHFPPLRQLLFQLREHAGQLVDVI